MAKPYKSRGAPLRASNKINATPPKTSEIPTPSTKDDVIRLVLKQNAGSRASAHVRAQRLDNGQLANKSQNAAQDGDEDDAAAVHQVLSNRELLEMILSHQTRRNILVLQRVSKRWYNIIRYSRNFQKSLFLRPAHPHTAYLFEERPGKLGLQDCTLHPIALLAPTDITKDQISGTDTKQNPYLLQSMKHRKKFSASRRKFTHQIYCGTRFVLSTELLLELQERKLQDSRMEMFLTQPPVQEVSVTVLSPYAGRNERISEVKDRVVQVEGGVKLRDVSEMLEGESKRRKFGLRVVSILIEPAALGEGRNAVFMKDAERRGVVGIMDKGA